MTLTVEAYLRHLRQATDSIAADAAAAGLKAPVPTCPGWSVADLLGHVGTVHRWAAAIITGGLATVELPPDVEAGLAAPADRAALGTWFVDGAAGVQRALRGTGDDLAAAVFLHAAPAPRLFWARRQAHETTIHRVDALAARLGRVPRADEFDVATPFAADGIDELLVGFLSRRSSRLRSDRPLRIHVSATDVGKAWIVAVSEQPPVTTALSSSAATPPGSTEPPDATFVGTATALYLGLWNRGDEISVIGDDDVLARWRRDVQVTWD